MITVKFSINDEREGSNALFNIKASGEIEFDPDKLADDNGTPYTELSKKAQREVINSAVINYVSNNFGEESVTKLTIKERVNE